MTHALSIDSLSKNYGDFQLEDVSFTLPAGFIMGLIGPNGAGKTTIIKLILNMVQRDKGKIAIYGCDNRINEIAVKERIGFVQETPTLYEHLTLKTIARMVAPFYHNWDWEKYKHYLTFFSLPANKKLSTLSHGMKMKFALTLALSHHADLLILDEPTSGLDPLARHELIEEFRQFIQDEQKAILFSTHITSDLERIADYITFVHDGRLIFSTTHTTIREEWGVVKGDTAILDHNAEAEFLGIRRHAFGFEALTTNIARTRQRFGDHIIVDRASLEDIMLFISRRHNHG